MENQELIYTISGKLEARKKSLNDLGKSSKKSYEEYKAHTGGIGRRLLLEIGGDGGKRSQKMEDSRLKWEGARMKEHEEQERIEALETQLSEAEANAVELKAQNKIFERLSTELEVLNQDLFDGETPGMYYVLKSLS